MACDCLDKIDALLVESGRNTKLSRNFILAGEMAGMYPGIQTELLEKKRGAKAPVMFPTYCPFCGTRYRGTPSGVEMISAERRRQVETEGWTAEHDDAHGDGALAQAAACYLMPTVLMDPAACYWPWSREWWKPGDRIRDLTKAGALIAAELDRLQRLEA